MLPAVNFNRLAKGAELHKSVVILENSVVSSHQPSLNMVQKIQRQQMVTARRNAIIVKNAIPDVLAVHLDATHQNA